MGETNNYSVGVNVNEIVHVLMLYGVWVPVL